MDWYSNSASNWAGDIFITELPDGINLREEVHGILYGTPTKNPLGHWVILRHYDRTSKSEYWNQYTKEGVGGPSYEYSDALIRTRRIPASKSSTESAIKIGNAFSDQFVYYLEYTVNVSLGDQIYELDVTDHTNEPSTYSFVEKYDIKRVHPYREAQGNTQYYTAVCEFNNITY